MDAKFWTTTKGDKKIGILCTLELLLFKTVKFMLWMDVIMSYEITLQHQEEQ